MKQVLLLLMMAALCLCFAALHADIPTPAPGPAMQEITPQTTDAPLVNPGMGLYLFGTLHPNDMPADVWFAPMLHIGYFRDDWAKLEPDAEGQYQFDAYFKPIFDLWVNRWHKRVAFRFMSSNMHSQGKYVTPKWVFDAGVPSVTHKGVYVPEQIDPVFWDDHYLRIQERFIADLGRYLDGRPGVEFIDIGGIGEWGEMHLSRWTPQQLRETGYTETKYIAAYRRLIDAYARAFPHTRVFLNVGDYAQINDYAALRGLHFRQDGLNPSGPSANVGKRFYVPYSRRGVQCNYELFSGYDEMKQKGWGVRETFAKGLEDPISYFHINLMGYHELLNPPAEVKEAVTDAARRIGFRFVLTRLRCGKTLHTGPAPSRLLVESDWKNIGVAPCYDSYALRWSVVSEAGKTVAEQTTYPSTPTTLWWSGEAVALRSIIPVPAGLTPGTYRLKVAMVKPEEPALCIQLGLAGRDADGRYDLCALPAAPGASPSGVVSSEGFEAGTGGWQAAPGMTVHADTTAHTGHGSLLLQGTQPGNAWNYASVDLKPPVLPAARYRFSCWMKVDALTPKDHAPYLKLGVNDAQGHWLTNFSTNPYDTSKLGAWQRIEGEADTPPAAALGQFAVEKGALEAHLTATIRLDDVTLELMEAP